MNEAPTPYGAAEGQTNLDKRCPKLSGNMLAMLEMSVSKAVDQSGAGLSLTTGVFELITADVLKVMID